MAGVVRLAVKIFIFVLVFTSFYYFLILVPRLKLQKSLTESHSNLVQNRIAFTELVRLDPSKPNFLLEKSDLITTLNETNRRGLEIARDDKEKNIYERQKVLLEKAFSTKSYEEGITVLKSQEAIALLTDQTNLILQMEFELQGLERR